MPGPGNREHLRLWRDAVASTWQKPALTGPINVEIEVDTRRSLVDLMKPVIDGLEPILGRDPWETNEFSPLDDTIVRLMVRRRPGELSLLVRVSPG